MTPLSNLPNPPISIASRNNEDSWAFTPLPKQLPRSHFIIDDESDESVDNIFAFGAFANENSGIVDHGLKGLFPFMSLGGSVCFFILYHYKLNSILANPSKVLDDRTIFEAYKKQFDELAKKGFKPKLNVMDNQATKYIKQFLDDNKCKLQLVEPHNHHVIAVERAIKMFKDAFIAALAMY
jgi:hypothetical protein